MPRVEKYVNRFGIFSEDHSITHEKEKIIKGSNCDSIDIVSRQYVTVYPNDPIIIVCKEATYPEIYVVITPNGMTYLSKNSFEYTDEA